VFLLASVKVGNTFWLFNFSAFSLLLLMSLLIVFIFVKYFDNAVENVRNCITNCYLVVLL